MKNTPSLIDVSKKLGTTEACIAYLEAMRWPDGVRCLVCGCNKISKFVTNETEREVTRKGVTKTVRVPARHLYTCLEPTCGFQFSPTAGTIMHDSHLPLSQWFMAAALMCNAKKGLSAKQMERDLGVSYRTAWYLCHRIRKAMESEGGVFGGTVELDETFVGGKYDRRRKRAKYDRQAVMGVVKRGDETGPSQVRAFTIPRPTRKVVEQVVAKHVSFDAEIFTDEWAGYRHLHTEDFRKHAIVIHSKGEYVRGKVHTNSVEGFWSLVKRQIIGQHHFVSVKHLQRYLNEMSFRFNNREAEDLFALVMLNLVIASGIKYAELTAKPASQTETSPEPF